MKKQKYIMSSQQPENGLKQRLDFIELDDSARQSLRQMRPRLARLGVSVGGDSFDGDRGS